jgi:hypothetical protein
VEEVSLKTRTEFVPETQCIIFQNIRWKKKKFKIEKQLIGRGGKTISHSTILLMRISVLTGEVTVYTTIPSWSKK